MTQVLTKKPRKGRIKPSEPAAAQLVSDAKGKKPVIQYPSGERAEVSRNSDEYLLLAAEQELLEREYQRRRLLPFVQKMNPKYTAGWAHELLARRLEKFLQDVLDKKSPRLMVTFPPRHGKSELTSRNFPAWVLGKHPWMEFILASYGMSLAEKFSRDVLDRIRDPHYALLFPEMQLKTESADQWSTTSGGGLRAAGARVGVTGMGAHILVIDDPFRDQKDADSDTIRNDTWDWYTTTAMTRLAPGGGVLIINTRWHDDDLSGRLLERMNEDEEFERFDCIDFPAIAEEDEYLSMDDRIVYAPEPGATLLRHKGEAMHPVRYGLKQLNAIKRVLHPRHWNALYQQKPVPDDGEFFSRNQFIEMDYGPQLLDGKAYIVCDFAISEKKLSDWTVIGAALHMPNDTIHLDDVDRFRSGDSARIVRSMVAMLKRYQAYNPILVVEDGQIWKSIASLFAAECRRERIYPVLQVMYALTDKAARATPLQGRMQMHMVTFKKGAPWFEALQNEFLRFPVGKHDDQVDMLAWAAQAILGKTPPRAKTAAQRGGKRLSVEQQLRKLMREQQHAVHDHMSA